jgi:NarL family two-component system response regulator LiaR
MADMKISTADKRDVSPVSDSTVAAPNGRSPEPVPPRRARKRRTASAPGGEPREQEQQAAADDPLARTAVRADRDRLRVVVADPDPLARRVMRDMLQNGAGFIVAAAVSNGVEAVELGLHYRPDLMLMEVALPQLDGIEVTRRIKRQAPEVSVVIFSVGQDPDVQLRALRAGASGFLPKSTDARSVARALRAVVQGEAAISRSLTQHLVELLRLTPEDARGMRPVKSTLTTREWEVLDLMSDGRSTREIAHELFLTEDTVYSHSKSIFKKLGVHSRTEAAQAAERLRRRAPESPQAQQPADAQAPAA